MTRSSSQNAPRGKSDREDYSPSARPADAASGDSVADDLPAAALQPAAGPSAAADAAPRVVEVPLSLAGERLDKALAQLFPEFSRSRLQSWIEAQRVLIDGAPAKIRQPVPLGAKIELVPDLLPEQLAFAAEPVPLDVIYEDDALVVINKPAGLVVHPAAGNWSGTLLNGLLHRYGDAAAGLPRAGIVHRLDKETSGLMVVARTLAAQTDLVRQLQARTVKRRYFALVWGTMPEEGTIDAPIGRDPRERTRMAVVTGASGKPARTHFRTVDTCVWQRQPVSAIQCDLETGRTHQIRVHCSHAGHPLLGDPVYGRARGKRSVTPLPNGFARQALHAWRLGLVHPVTGKAMQWRCPLPDDMNELVAALGFGQGDDEFDDDGIYDDDDFAGEYHDDEPYQDDEEE
ncbi:RluA family pseudouridine synthase [Burkholderia vietnamiensis]|uniref:RluA family pseudouridine synthase n=1 Tax=Burkholderia vietnamiensis TaxID=60552 RepID=UPI00075A3D52|nr:RluA family pseudouridine synthase [Burkholderia vietnamiensis]KVR82329.1 pseudouridine synthase [Burkholderia vietnamiensis]KVS25321.1 pseudouridine synthase [Burkholderia vietnamiensis]MBR8152582.1 RluA family pseudouridine synthase [Burkholderia vietnamiensis]